MYSFSYLEPVCCSMSSSNCWFLTCIQVFQDTGQVVWYSHLLKNFPQFVVIHIVKSLSVVNEAEVNFFFNSLAVSMIQWMLAIWSLVPLPFLNPAWTSGNSQFMYCFLLGFFSPSPLLSSHWLMYCWSLAWRIFSITLLACEMSAIVW